MKQIVHIFSNSLGHVEVRKMNHNLDLRVESINEYYDTDDYKGKSYMVHFEGSYRLLEVLDVCWVVWDKEN